MGRLDSASDNDFSANLCLSTICMGAECIDPEPHCEASEDGRTVLPCAHAMSAVSVIEIRSLLVQIVV
jgi:hypothetical protein